MSEVKRSHSPSEGESGSDCKRSRTELDEVAVFLFRRDLRVTDNTGLQALCEEATRRSLNVLPVFFFNPVQCDKKKNAYFGDHFFQFFCESLIDLDGPDQLKKHLVCLRGTDTECLSQIRHCGYKVTLLGYNEDLTPFAQARDQLLSARAEEEGITCVLGKVDYTLRPLDEVVSGSDKPYSVFTPFYNAFMASHVTKIEAPIRTRIDHIQSLLLPQSHKYMEKYRIDPAQLYHHDAAVQDKGGRTAGMARLDEVKNLSNYGTIRDDIAHDQTSHLSPHLKCGTVSIREAWNASLRHLGANHAFTRQLVWREFYAMLLQNHPRLVQGQLNAFVGNKAIVQSTTPLQNAPFQAKYDNFVWDWDSNHFEAFKEGRTGVPLVDAAVRCLQQTGWCHNRCRMVIANFAVKVLSVDWRECERWYATVAVDYDVANNNGGWLWSSGQGADSQPFFRTFNPFRQSARFDPDCKYIFRWVPELKEVPPAIVHDWENYCIKLANHAKSGNGKKKLEVYKTTYPAPIVDIKACREGVINQFRYHSATQS